MTHSCLALSAQFATKALCMLQGKNMHQACMDISKLAQPVFNGSDADVLACEAKVDSKVSSDA